MRRCYRKLKRNDLCHTTGKFKHSGRRQAEIAVEYHNTEEGDNTVHAYFCKHCSRWHTGHQKISRIS